MLVQIGYEKVGWCSYDWIDNDIQPSADRILSDYQDLEPGDTILMMSDMGFVVNAVTSHARLSACCRTGRRAGA